jgi:hypothetical protein
MIECGEGGHPPEKRGWMNEAYEATEATGRRSRWERRFQEKWGRCRCWRSDSEYGGEI